MARWVTVRGKPSLHDPLDEDRNIYYWDVETGNTFRTKPDVADDFWHYRFCPEHDGDVFFAWRLNLSCWELPRFDQARMDKAWRQMQFYVVICTRAVQEAWQQAQPPVIPAVVEEDTSDKLWIDSSGESIDEETYCVALGDGRMLLTDTKPPKVHCSWIMREDAPRIFFRTMRNRPRAVAVPRQQ